MVAPPKESIRSALGAEPWKPITEPSLVQQTFDDDSGKYWNISPEHNTKVKIGQPTQLQTAFSDRLLGDYSLLNNPSKKEISGLRKTAGRIFQDGVELKPDGINKFIRTRNPLDLKFSEIGSEALEKQTGVLSTDKKVRGEQIRVLQTTGLDPKGEFIVPEVLKQASLNLDIDKLKLQLAYRSITKDQFDTGMEKIFTRRNQEFGRKSVPSQQLKYDPLKANVYGTPRGPSGDIRGIPEFLAHLNKSWTDAGSDAKFIQTETGWKFDRGHIFAAKPEDAPLFRGGSNLDQNLAYQLKVADPNFEWTDSDYQKGKIGTYTDPTSGKEVLNWANIPQQNTVSKPLADLEQVFRGKNIVEGYQEFTMMDDPNKINWFKRLNPAQISEAAHDPRIGAEAAAFKGEQQNLKDTQRMEEAVASFKAPSDPKANPTIPDVPEGTKPKGLFNRVKNTLLDTKTIKNIAGVAGQSNNPLANIAGDFVGTVIDGVAFASNPKDKSAFIDLALSGSQLGVTIVAGGVALLPIPGARPGAFAIMKVGDNIGKIERLWNLTSKGVDSSKLKASTKKRLNI